MNKILIGILSVVVIGALGVMLFAGEDSKLSMSENESEQMVQNANPSNETGDKVSNTNQVSANALVLGDNDTGNTVTVDYVRLEKPGFVSLYRTNSQSDVTFIGSSDLLTPGEYRNLDIKVDTILAREQMVTGVLYADEGNGEFNFPDEDYYLTNNYEVVTDVDVIDIDKEDESDEVLEQAKAYIEANTSVEYES